MVITYAIVGGVDAAKFNIDPASGQLSFKVAPDFEQPGDANADNIYEVTVSADDGLGRVSRQSVKITVTDVQENNQPTFSSPAVFTVSENVLDIGTVVAVAGAPPPPSGFQFPDTPARTASTKTLTGVPTYESIGLYWNAAQGQDGREAIVRYREVGGVWKQGFSMTWDSRSQHIGANDPVGAPVIGFGLQYRTSLVMCKPGTSYEIEAWCNGEVAAATVTTWPDVMPKGTTTLVGAGSSQYTISASGTPTAYRVYDFQNSLRGMAASNEAPIVVDADYVIVRRAKITAALWSAIRIDRGGHHDIIVEDCDISGWNSQNNDTMGAIGPRSFEDNSTCKRITVQRNKIHHPAVGSRDWNFGHPMGAQAFSSWDDGGNHVIRWNEIYSDMNKMMNDCIGGGENFSAKGFPGPDTDIYGNIISYCWDGGVEAEGGGCNVRVWGNYFDHVYNAIETTPTIIGPFFAFRNVSYRTQFSTTSNLMSGRFLKSLAQGYTGVPGKQYFFHNTAYKDANGGCSQGLWGDFPYITAYNNIFTTDWHPTESFVASAVYDYNLETGTEYLLPQAPHSIRGQLPIYDPTHPSGAYTLADTSPGRGTSLYLPGFNTVGDDMGAQQRGAPALKFGLAASR